MKKIQSKAEDDTGQFSNKIINEFQP